MRLWLVRHAVAVERIPNGLEDADRKLTPKGRRHFKALARLLAASGNVPDLIITSPLVRAVQTTEILRHEAGLKKKHVRVEKFASPGMDARRLVRALRNLEAETVAVVGHEPDMSAVAKQMLSGGRLLFGKGHIACIEFEDGPTLKSGHLAWFLGTQLGRKKKN